MPESVDCSIDSQALNSANAQRKRALRSRLACSHAHPDDGPSMITRFLRLATLTAAVAAVGGVPAPAAAQSLLTAAFGGTQATNFGLACPQNFCYSNGPTAVGINGFFVTYSAVPDLNYPQQPVISDAGFNYHLGDNGDWSNVAWAATNGTSAISLTFATPVTAVGGIMNYAICAPDVGCGGGLPWLRAYDAGNSLIGAWDLSQGGGISTPNGLDIGAFRGVSHAGGIARLELQGAYLLTQNLYAQSTAVPEPTSLLLVGIGVAGIALLRRRRA